MNAASEHAVVGRVTKTASARGAMLKRFLAYLDRIEYRRVSGGEALEDIARLRYKSYLQNSLVMQNESKQIIDRYDGDENAYIFGVYLDEALVATIRLHHASRDFPRSPAMDMYSDILLPRLQSGDSYIDPSKLAVDPDIVSGSIMIPTVTMRLAYVACKYLQVPYYITMLRDDHEVFYKRMFGFYRIAEARDYKGAVNCSVPLYEGDIARFGATTVERFPFFQFTEAEGRMLFSRPGIGMDAPLSVLPSAKYLIGEAA